MRQVRKRFSRSNNLAQHVRTHGREEGTGVGILASQLRMHHQEMLSEPEFESDEDSMMADPREIEANADVGAAAEGEEGLLLPQEAMQEHGMYNMPQFPGSAPVIPSLPSDAFAFNGLVTPPGSAAFMPIDSATWPP